MVSDMEILLWLNDSRSKLKKQLSVMAGVFNSRSADFFKQLDVSRIVLPREMSLSEMERLIQHASRDIEFETIVMFQKCRFIDSFCNFHHACHEDHGCQLDYFCRGEKVKHADNNDFDTPYCAACALEKLSQAGIRHFKIAGRGYPVELITSAIKFIRQTGEAENRQPPLIKQHYKNAFGNRCKPTNCYYQ
jgi:putative protease